MESSPDEQETLLVAWGNAQDGQLGLGEKGEEYVANPILLRSLLEIRGLQILQLSCGWNHTVLLLSSGLVYSFGSNKNGQLGRNGAADKPERIDALEAMVIKQVSCGRAHTLVLNVKGQVFAFGDNAFGQLGQGSSVEKIKKTPRIVKGFPSSTHVAVIASGGDHCLALDSGGQLYGWGRNGYGQIGLGYSSSQFVSSPQAVREGYGLPYVMLAAGANHSLAVTRSGCLLSWGRNSSGQLGLQDEIDRTTPTLVVSLKSHRVSHVTCGNNHTAVLTNQGRVFTFGEGSCGQLGHNSLNNESRPRQVLELMGSEVIQIACGRHHTMALVASSGRLYATGSNSKRQFGPSPKNLVTVPVVINNTWKESIDGLLHRASYLTHIFSGGEHSFAAFCEDKTRVINMMSPSRSQLDLFIDEANVKEIVGRFKAGSDAKALKRDREYIRRIFSSQACLNGSFLRKHKLEEDFSFGHGLNMPAVRRSLNTLDSIPFLSTVSWSDCFTSPELPRIKDMIDYLRPLQSNDLFLRHLVRTKICDAIVEKNIPTLNVNPIDAEALRIYLILPELSAFAKEEYAMRLTVPLGNCILSLHPVPYSVLADWWKGLPATFFSRIIEVFQSCVKCALKPATPMSYPPNEWFARHGMLMTCMEVLKRLDKVNEDGGFIVTHTTFYIPEVQEGMNIQADFVNWIQQPNAFSFCRYPFVFDTKGKSILLQTDVLMQMRFAVDQVQRVNLHNMFSGVLFDPLSPMLTLKIRRDHLKEDALREITTVHPFEFKKPLKVIFDGEEGVDAGGVKKEFFYLLLREIVHPKYGMFVEMEESRVMWFNSQSFEGPEMYLLIGILVGLAIYNSTIINVDFPLVLYKKLLKKKPNMDDFREVQPNVARNLQYLLDYSEDDLEEVFDLTFQITVSNYGALEHIDLIPGGDSVLVNNENREQFVNAYIDFFLNKSIDNQFSAFSEGFHRVCSGRVLDFFHPQELMEMVVGSQDYDFKEFEQGTIYQGEYYRNHPVIIRFWDVFTEFSLEEKKQFLAFLTGSSKVPIYGLKSLQFTIQPVSGGVDGSHLPVAHTCFNILDLPKYETKEEMRKKLTQAIQYSEGFGLA